VLPQAEGETAAQYETVEEADPADKNKEWDWGDQPTPSEEIALEVFHAIVRYAPIPREFSVGGMASDFIETIIGGVIDGLTRVDLLDLKREAEELKALDYA
jgi:hypothetical protein